MCELFGMSSRSPANVRLSLAEFARHGGASGPHRDGWGIAYYDGHDAQRLREAAPASASAWVEFLDAHPFASATVVSHIRRATQGARILANTQPFARELGGFVHVFAHNGDLRPQALRAAFPALDCRPVGDTDSEYAFCALLEALRPLWVAARAVPPLAHRTAALARFATQLRTFGPANFLYADGDALFAHGHERRQPDGNLSPPGLHVLHRRCAQPGGRLDGSGVSVDSPAGEQEVTLFASVPLSDEGGWAPLAPGELVVARNGIIVQRIRPGEPNRPARDAAMETS